MRERVTTLKERLANLANRVQEQGQQDKDTRQITAAVGDIQAYVKAIQEYANQHPRDEGLAGYSKRVADESLGWQAVADWNKLVEELRQGGVAGLRPKAAEEEAELVKTVCDTFDDCTEGERLRRMLLIQGDRRPRQRGRTARSVLEEVVFRPPGSQRLGGGNGGWAAILRDRQTAGRQEFPLCDRFRGRDHGETFSALPDAEKAECIVRRR